MEMIEKVTKVVFHKINQNDLRTGIIREFQDKKGNKKNKEVRGKGEITGAKGIIKQKNPIQESLTTTKKKKEGQKFRNHQLMTSIID